MSRIALLLETDGPGGAEYMLLHLAEELRRRGHEVIPVNPDDRKGWLGEQFRDRGFETETFRIRRPFDVRCVLRLVRIFRARGIDLVHSHEFSLAVFGAAAARITRLPHVITMHGGRYYADRRRRRMALRWAIRASRRTVAVSRATRKDLIETLGDGVAPIDVVPNGIPPRSGDGERVRRELGLEPDEPLMLSVGSLYPIKGHRVLVDAAVHLGREAPDLSWTIAIAGTGQEEESLRKRIRHAGLEDRVRLLGFRSDVGDLLDACRVFVMPSLSEGLPLALLEAMHAERTIVASGVGGIPEAVSTGREAVLVPPGDSRALARSLYAVLEDAGLRKRLAAAARERARARFSLASMGDAYEDIYGWRAPVTAPDRALTAVRVARVAGVEPDESAQNAPDEPAQDAPAASGNAAPAGADVAPDHSRTLDGERVPVPESVRRPERSWTDDSDRRQTDTAESMEG